MRPRKPTLPETCARKVAHRTWDDADRACMEILFRGGSVNFAYRCDLCPWWHTSSMRFSSGMTNNVYSSVQAIVKAEREWREGRRVGDSKLRRAVRRGNPKYHGYSVEVPHGRAGGGA